MTVKANSAKKKTTRISAVMLKLPSASGLDAADDDRMDGAEQADGEEGDRCAEAAHQSIDCAKAGAAVGVVNSLAEHEVGDVDQLGDRGGGETWIPRPPGIPGGACPDGAKHNRDQEEHQAHFDRRDLKAVPFQVFCDQIDHAEYRCKDEAEQGRPGGANVEVKHALHISHHQFGRCKDKGKIGCNAKHEDGNNIKNF